MDNNNIRAGAQRGVTFAPFAVQRKTKKHKKQKRAPGGRATAKKFVSSHRNELLLIIGLNYIELIKYVIIKWMKQRILIVDDEKPLAMALELKLIHEGLIAKTVFNGVEAIKILKSDNFDLVLLDLVMPQEDGFKVLETIHDLKIKTPVIVSSNLSQEEDINRAKALGAVDYFIKSDTSLADIISKVKEYLSK